MENQFRTIRITVFGLQIKDVVESIFRTLEVNRVNPINPISFGSFGNFRTINYEIAIDESKVIETRKELLEKLARESTYLEPLTSVKDRMSIFIFFKPVMDRSRT